MTFLDLRHALGVVLGAAALAAVSADALAQFRTLPVNGTRGTVTAQEWPGLGISGKPYRMAPGAVIFDDSNRTITPNFLPVGVEVYFTQAGSGEIMRVYILSAQERERLDAAKKK